MPESFEAMTLSQSETEKFAGKIGKLLNEGDLIFLCGELGAGKTTFTKGLAKGLAVKGRVSSPTYTIINEYDGRLPVYHFDLYRIESLKELEVIGYEDYYFGKGVTVVEWGDKIQNSLPDDYLSISLNRITGKENSRSFVFKASSVKVDGLVEKIHKLAKESGIIVNNA